MTPERWEKVGELYQAALERAPHERAGFLDHACDGDVNLRREVEALLAAENRAGSFMSNDAIEDAARLLADERADALIGQTLGHYEILELLGQGGMGEVYLAEDTRLKRKIALKVLPTYFLISRHRVNRFEQEARAISALNHPNIVTIHEVGRIDGSSFIVTEFVEGQTLRELMSKKRLPLIEALDIAIQVASALEAAHAAGVIHRDIKPENVMLRHDGYVKVLDFGLAKLAERHHGHLGDAPTRLFAETEPGMVMGSTSYMSPEQARAETVDERADIWSMGVVLFEMLTGSTPFEGDTPSHVIVSILEKEPPLISEYLAGPTEELQRTTSKALRKNRDERYQTVKELSTDLRKIKQGLERSNAGELLLSAASSANNPMPTVASSSSSAEYLVNEIKRHKTSFILGLLAALLLVVMSGYWFYFRPPTEATDAIESVAVLPLVNVDNDPNKQYLCEGISNSIIDKLSLLPDLRVASFNSVLRYKSQQPDQQAIGKALNVRALLIGRLTQRGEDLTISAELVDVRDNRRLWGGQYNRKISDLVATQSEIAQQVSEKLRLKLSGAQQQRLAKNYTDNVQAYRLYTLGDYYLRPQAKEGLIKSIEFYEQARSIDQNYALAYVGLFKAYFTLGLRGFWPPGECRYKAEWAALRAVELDDSLASAHAVLGFVKEGIRWDWAGAEQEMRRALDLNPNSFDANFGYSTFLVHHGRADEAMAYAKRAEEINPVFPMVAYVCLHQRQFEKAIQLYSQPKADRAVDRGNFQLAEAYIGAGRYEEAIAEMQKVIANVDSPERWDRFPILAYAYAAAGRKDEALKILSEQKTLAKKTYVSPFNFAVIYMGLGYKDRAYEYLNKAFEEHSVMLHHFPSRPLFDPLRSDPRFADLVRRMNLPPERFTKT